MIVFGFSIEKLRNLFNNRLLVRSFIKTVGESKGSANSTMGLLRHLQIPPPSPHLRMILNGDNVDGGEAFQITPIVEYHKNNGILRRGKPHGAVNSRQKR